MKGQGSLKNKKLGPDGDVGSKYHDIYKENSQFELISLYLWYHFLMMDVRQFPDLFEFNLL